MIALLVLCLASSAFALDQQVAHKGFVFDFFTTLAMNMIESYLGFSLSLVWETIYGLGAAIVAQFVALMAQVLMLGQAAVALVAPIFSQLYTDLVNHAADALTLVTNALSQMSTLLLGKRNAVGETRLFDFFTTLAMNMIESYLGFSLALVWETIYGLGAHIVAQFVALMAQVLLMGQAAVALVAPILSQLYTDLVNHAADALTLVTNALSQMSTLLLGKRSVVAETRFFDFFTNLVINMIESYLGFSLSLVWETIYGLGAAIVAQFVMLMAQVLMLGQAAVALVAPIFSQLYTDLVNHAADALTLVTNALSQMSTLLLGKRSAGAENRALFDFFTTLAMNMIESYLGFSLSLVWETIYGLGAAIVAQFVMLMAQVLMLGQAAVALVAPIFSQLYTDLVNHAADALTLVTNALSQMSTLLLGK